MVAEAREYEARDEQRRREIEARNRADDMAYQAEQTLERHGDALPVALREEVRGRVAAVRQALRSGQVEALERAMQELTEITQRIADSVWQDANCEA